MANATHKQNVWIAVDTNTVPAAALNKIVSVALDSDDGAGIVNVRNGDAIGGQILLTITNAGAGTTTWHGVLKADEGLYIETTGAATNKTVFLYNV